MTDPTATRRRDELLELLEQRRRAFHQQPPHVQDGINRERFIDVEELHQLLDHYLTHGCCADEAINVLGQARPRHYNAA